MLLSFLAFDAKGGENVGSFWENFCCMHVGGERMKPQVTEGAKHLNLHEIGTLFLGGAIMHLMMHYMP